MLSLNDIKHKRFQKASLRGGYMREEVDDFLDEVETSYDTLIQKTAEQRDNLERKNNEVSKLQDKIKELEEQIKQYRGEEDEIKEALLSAQKMRDTALKEAQQQADEIIHQANEKANVIVNGASKNIVSEQEKLREMKQAVSDFRAKLMQMYKQHLTLINEIPHMEKKPAPQAEPAAPQTAEKPQPVAAAQPQQAEPAVPVEPEKPAAAPAAPVAVAAPVPAVQSQKEPNTAPVKRQQPQPVTFATTPDEPDYLTAKPFDPVPPKKDQKKKPAGAFSDEYDLDDEDASEIFSKRH
ncbi:MAG: DivIVA domain-containing protein [Oscillospiraceae bacterium]|nr:DivIVA domain-containing protein [Oscillospiraceae bacterium]